MTRAAPGKSERRGLIDQGLAGTCRHDDEGVVSRQHRVQGVELTGAKGGIVKVLRERGMERGVVNGYGHAHYFRQVGSKCKGSHP